MSDEIVDIDKHMRELGVKPDAGTITKEQNDAAVETDGGAGWDEASSLVPDEDIGHSSSVLQVEEVDEPEAKEVEGAGTEEAEAETQEAAGEAAPEEEFTFSDFKRMRSELGAATAERNRLRKLRQRDTRELVGLKKSVGEITEHLRNQQIEPVPQEVLDDPVVKYFERRFDGIENRLPQGVDPGEPDMAAIAAEVTNYASQSASEYLAHTPEWSEAYKFSREHFAADAGLTNSPNRENEVNLREQAMVYYWREQGLDPAHEVMKYARSKGFGGTNGAAGTPAAPAAPTTIERKVKRLRHGIDGNAAANANTERQTQSGTMSRENFYENTTKEQRMKIFQENPDAFEQVTQSGVISTRYLEH